MSVEGVSLTLLTGLNSIYQSICLHLTPENREAILGSALSKMSGRGTGKTAVASALYSDALRIVLSAIDADGKISSDEMAECETFLVTVASTFAKIRSEYGEFANLSKTETRIFLQHYKTDKGVFGYRDESTKWAGLSICRNVEQYCSDGLPLETFRKLLLSAARTLIAADGVSVGEQGFLSKLSKQLKSQSVSDSRDDELIMEFLGSSSTGKPNHSQFVKPTVKTNQEWADAMSPGTEEPSRMSQPKMALYSDSTIRNSTSRSETRITQPEKSKPKISEPVCCPKCGSSTIFGTTRGFNQANGAIGLLGMGPAAAMYMGSRNSSDVINNCQKCGHSWKPAPHYEIREMSDEELQSSSNIGMAIVAGLVSSTLSGIGCYLASVDPLDGIRIIFLAWLPGFILWYFFGFKIHHKVMANIALSCLAIGFLVPLAAIVIGIVVFVFLSFTGQIRY